MRRERERERERERRRDEKGRVGGEEEVRGRERAEREECSMRDGERRQ